MASLVASLSVRVPLVTGITSAPMRRMRKTLSDCRRMSSSPMYTTHWRPKRAHTVAVATPCCPAPVSAMIRDLPMRRASSTCPTVLLILCAPVWFRSSRLRYTRAPTCSERRGASLSGEGRPTYVESIVERSARNDGSPCAVAYATSSSSSAAMSVSGTYRPPKAPNRSECWVGAVMLFTLVAGGVHGGDEGPDARMILYAGRRFNARRHVDDHG